MRRTKKTTPAREIPAALDEALMTLLNDPQAVDLLRAYLRIKEPKKRAFIAWFVSALAEED